MRLDATLSLAFHYICIYWYLCFTVNISLPVCCCQHLAVDVLLSTPYHRYVAVNILLPVSRC